MSFGRIPYQFSAINPTERQVDLQKRFGLPKQEDMYVDLMNSGNLGSASRGMNSAASSPRLQHRVPVFTEDYSHPLQASKVQSNNVDNARKPNVRVIPIEIEGSPKPARHRTFSGPSMPRKSGEFHDDRYVPLTTPLQHSVQDNSMASRKRVPSGDSKKRVHNIPIQIVKTDGKSNDAVPHKVNKPSHFKRDVKINNGCSMSKEIPVIKTENQESELKPKEPDFEISLKKIEDILEELKGYQTSVENFIGTSKDKQYRYLDEMLTRCMLRLDDIDTMGNESVRAQRKAAVKKVQSCIDLLEEKINRSSEVKDDQVMPSEIEMQVSNNSEIKDKDISTSLSNECKLPSDVPQTEETSDDVMGETDSAHANSVSADAFQNNKVCEPVVVTSSKQAKNESLTEGSCEIGKEVSDVEMLEENQNNIENQVSTSFNDKNDLVNLQSEKESLEVVMEEAHAELENAHISGIDTTENCQSTAVIRDVEMKDNCNAFKSQNVLGSTSTEDNNICKDNSNFVNDCEMESQESCQTSVESIPCGVLTEKGNIEVSEHSDSQQTESDHLGAVERTATTYLNS